MADKRISQLVDRGTVANNDVVPIVVSGATTTNKATISSIQTFMQGNLDLGVTSVGITLGSSGTDVSVSGSPITSSGNITINLPTASATNRGLLSSANWTTFNNKVSSVGLSMPSAFSVANSPITGSGTIAVTGAGTVSQYVRGDGSLADFPQGGGGGGASVNYYLNGSVSQGSIGGIGYSQMSKTPILGAGTDFTIASTNYIASFITDAGNPALLEIPAGNWNFESYFSASSGGGSPSFYIELYKVNSGGTATLIASSSATPELISFGTSISPYFSPLAVPATVLTITDRLAVRYFVNNSGRTITLHTENSHLCQIITTFTTGLTALNGLTAQVQNFATGTSGTDFAISSTSATHTFNLPTASATNRGALSSADWTTFNNKQAAGNYVTTDTNQSITGFKSFVNGFSLASEGGTNQATTLINTGSIHEGSAGTNQIGFNNSNNIYFGKGLNNGGLLQWNNAAVRYYTLPDADGTLALTSNLSGYLPLTGGTLTGALNGTSAAFTGAISGSANTITATTGIAGDFTNNSTTNETLRARNNGSGNIAAFRNASAEVASISNSGGLTLSGALNGTSATFSGNVALGTATLLSGGGAASWLTLNGTPYSGGIVYAVSSVAKGYSYYDNALNVIAVQGNTGVGAALIVNGTTNALVIASTGVPTFTVSGADTRLANFSTVIYGSARGLRINSYTSSNGAQDCGVEFDSGIAGYGGFKLSNSGTPMLTITAAGAATFSSSVTAIGLLQSNDRLYMPGNQPISNWFSSSLSAGYSSSNGYGWVNGAGSLVLGTDGVERMRITSVGHVLIGQTVASGLTNGIYLRKGQESGFIVTDDVAIQLSRYNSNGDIQTFYRDNTRVGSISVTTVATSYNVTSDYRLKEDLQEIKGLEKVLALKVYDYKWKSEESRMDGVLAHELADVLPYAVTGEKDEVDQDGYDRMQSVDYSKIVPILIKAIQELKTEIDSLKNQIK